MSLTLASFLTDFWNHQLVEHERQGLFLVLVGFVGSFGFIRFSTRMMRSPRFDWWPGSVVSDSGVHLHHLVFGIWLMVGCGTLGFLLFNISPWWEICALLFGIGAGLTVDEFALWVHLEDVYWSDEGRSSVDAAAIAVAVMAMLMVGSRPGEWAGSHTLAFATLALVLLLVLVCLSKQRLMHGAIGLFLTPLVVYGALRLGKPRSPWARRFYGERNPKKQAAADARFRPGRRTEWIKDAFRDAVGGTTESAYHGKLSADRTRQEVRRRADAADRPQRGP